MKWGERSTIPEEAAAWVRTKVDRLGARQKLGSLVQAATKQVGHVEHEPLPYGRERQVYFRTRLKEASEVIVRQTDALSQLDIEDDEISQFTDQVGYFLARTIRNRHDQAAKTGEIASRLSRDAVSHIGHAYLLSQPWSLYFAKESVAETTFLRSLSYAADHVVSHTVSFLDQGYKKRQYATFLNAFEQVLSREDNALESLQDTLSGLPKIDAGQGRYAKDKQEIATYRDSLRKEQEVIVFEKSQ